MNTHTHTHTHASMLIPATAVSALLLTFHPQGRAGLQEKNHSHWAVEFGEQPGDWWASSVPAMSGSLAWFSRNQSLCDFCMMSQHLVVPSPSAAFYVQQGNVGFFETGFLEQEQREPSVKGVSSGDTPWGKMWDQLGSEPTAGEGKAAVSQRSSSRILIAPGPSFVILKWCLHHWSYLGPGGVR